MRVTLVVQLMRVYKLGLSLTMFCLFQIFLKLFGVSTWMQWLAWITFYVFLSLVTVVLVTIMLCYRIKMKHVLVDGAVSQEPYYSSITGDVDPPIMFALLFGFSLSIVSYGILIGCFFTRGESIDYHFCLTRLVHTVRKRLARMYKYIQPLFTTITLISY